ncbi:MAG: YbjQ family protein [Bradyrhizobium sp.]|uniref:YbjQ family protein n=1 Tax=Bradyrhizobium sp. TaxID=376 RepID=UPI003D0D00B8
MLTTEACPSGLIIDRRIAIIAAECAYGVNIVRDFFAGITDMTGGRSETLEAVLRDARTKALDDLRLQASNLKANGVIGVTLAYNEITGKDKSMLLVVASGTAVEIRESGGRK